MSTTHNARARITLIPDLPICQTDLPLDWYQDELKPYAEQYLALPDRTPGTVLPWLDGYVQPALQHFGPSLLLLAHFYMGGAIVKLVESSDFAIPKSVTQTSKQEDTRMFDGLTSRCTTLRACA